MERKPDQLWKVTNTEGHTFLLQLEFQLADETGMINRMLEYRGILRRKFGLAVRQYVLFLSDSLPSMANRLGRSLKHLLEVVALLKQKNVAIQSIQDSIDTNSA